VQCPSVAGVCGCLGRVCGRSLFPNSLCSVLLNIPPSGAIPTGHHSARRNRLCVVKNPASHDGTLIFQSKFGTTRDTL
jgi:hypothetical protein